ncbi:MAG TPA: hypothetical protein VFT12_05565 [Thermoanaerobaculia bacterium]|nr:hypothetical protein [Thermoanaerobaculia bacterium]
MDLNDKKARFFARRMHTPDDAPHAAAREALRLASRALIPLHRALIEATKSDYAFAYEPVDQPTQLFRLVSDHPFFAWLRPITTLIVEIDELAQRDFELAEAAAMGRRIEQLFGGPPDAEFAQRYIPILQRDVDVAIGHAEVRKAAAALQQQA